MGLFKVTTSSFINEEHINHLLKKYSARFILIEKDFTVFEATGQEDEINNLTTELKKFGLIEFIKSARIALTLTNESFDI